MCTLAAFVGVWPGSPLVVAANRDERLDRPASGPRRWAGEPFMAPRDEQSGGTWLGLNRWGLFVGITNRAGSTPDPSRASRGQLVVEALRLESARAVHAAFDDTLDAKRFNAFHLLYADTSGDAFVTWFDGESTHREQLSAGLTVVTERSLGGDDHGRIERVRRHLEPLVRRDATPPLEELAPALREHVEGDPIGSACVHVPALRYGTRSSLLLHVAPDPRRSVWLWTEGPPCTTAYAEIRVELG